MRITGRDYTDDDLIAPWDPARPRVQPNGQRDDPSWDDDRNERDELGNDETESPPEMSNP